MPKLLDTAKFCEDLKEVTSKNILIRKRFHPNGLFSEQIFGPLKNFTCQCGTFYGSTSMIEKCTKCGVDITRSIERRRRFAKIVLPFPVVNPIMYDLVVSLGGREIKKPIDNIMKNERFVLYVNEKTNDYIVKEEDDSKYKYPTFKKFEKTDAIYELIKWLANDLSDIKEWNFIKENLDKILIRELIVLPPDLRPISKAAREDQMITDPINRLYVSILTKIESMLETILEVSRNKQLFYNYFRLIQKDVFEIYEYTLSKISKKEGLVRKHILGKRIDFSGRAVITPDPTLKLDECCLPYTMVLELFKLQISKKLIDIEKFKFINNAIEFVDQCIDLSDPCLLGICNEIVKDEVCLLNRQPSLHRLSLIGFKIKVALGNTIRIHPLVCPGFNADFDGDQMAVYIPLYEETKREVLDKFLASKNLLSPSNYSLTTTPSQDIVLGIYILTNNMIPALNEKVECKGKMVTQGVKIFNDCLPKNYPLIDHTIRKKELLAILNHITERFKPEETVKTLDNIKEIGFKYSTLYGVSLSLDNIAIDGINEFRDEIYRKENVREQLEIISGKETEEMLKHKFKYAYLIDSGARGSWDQARQIILTRGFVSNFKGQILSTPVKGNLIDGLSQEDFFLSTYGCRKGLLDVAVNTSASGYLSRKLIFSCANLQKDPDLEDCGTKDYLKVYVESEKKAAMLEFRYRLNPESGKEEMITKHNYKDIVGKIILLRSPIYCKSEKICHKCYGDLWKVIDSKYIGVLAAQALGEVGTQLVLRVFHNSGVAQIKENDKKDEIIDDMKQMDIIGDLSSASKLLHIRNKNSTCEQLVHDLFDVYSTSKSIHHIHFESVISQLMWYGDRKWRLIVDRDKKSPTYYSIQTVPEKESWILGLAFSNPKKNIINGITHAGNYRGILDNILLGKIF